MNLYLVALQTENGGYEKNEGLWVHLEAGQVRRRLQTIRNLDNTLIISQLYPFFVTLLHHKIKVLGNLLQKQRNKKK